MIGIIERVRHFRVALLEEGKHALQSLSNIIILRPHLAFSILVGPIYDMGFLMALPAFVVVPNIDYYLAQVSPGPNFFI